MDTIHVVLADDHTLLRAGLIALLGSIPGVAVIGEAGDGVEALALLAERRPDVLLSDISMPRLNGLELTQRVTQDWPATRVIILSMHATEEYVCQALQAGASGYLLKDSGIAELGLAVRAVARGETYLSPSVSKHVIARYSQRTSSEPKGIELLTPRQREILRLIALGQSTKVIAWILGISGKTVETHRMQLMNRLDIHEIAGLVRFAMRAGLIEAE